MKLLCKGIVVTVVLCVASFSTQAAIGGTSPPPPPATYLDKILTTPDYTQTDPDYGGFPDENGVLHGGVFCGPAAASNSVMWLSNNGYPNLSAHSLDPKEDQHDLIHTISGDSYMDAYDRNSVGATMMATGLRDYITACDYQIKSLQFEGLRTDVPAEFDTDIDVPNINWMKRGIIGPGNVELWSVGWSHFNGSTYEVIGGHWVTVVGYDNDEFIIHDPSPRTNGPDPVGNEYVSLTPIASTGDYNGQYLMSGWPQSSAGDCAILLGAYVLDMEQAPVPEPSMLVLLLGLGAMAFVMKRRSGS